VALDVLRDGKSQTVSMVTEVRPSGDRRDGDEPAGSAADDQGVLNGVGVTDIDPRARRDLNLPERLNGALISSVDPDSAAARAGIREGDVILEINRQPVDSSKAAVDLSSDAKSRKTLVKLWSHGSTVYVVVDETPAASADAAQ
jgi:serine protease Do